MATETEIDVLTTERDNALLRAEELEHQLRRKVEDCGCDGQAYEEIRAERDQAIVERIDAREAVAAMTVEIADLRAELDSLRWMREELVAALAKASRLASERDTWEYFADLLFGYYDAEEGSDDVAQRWHEAAAAIRHYRMTGGTDPAVRYLDPVVTADAGEGSAVTTDPAEQLIDSVLREAREEER